ncbi:MAG TPA: Ig-like domain-containing protein [Gemmatimonadales bacterium]|nr:Ig-like domain-containing protein [Gemmatimonadales bacterium]
MKILELRSVAFALAVGACGGDPAAPEPQVPRPFEAVVTNPVSAGAPGAAAIRGTSVAYVSLSPGSIPSGLTVTIDNARTGERVTGDLIEGGFDPLAIAAEVSDTIVVGVVLPGGERKEARFPVPPGRRLLVVRTDPSPGKRDVPLNSNLLVVLSEPLDPASITEGAIVLRRGDQTIATELELVTGKPWVVQVAPLEPLAPSADYTLTLTAGLRDRDGESLQDESTVPFTTEEALPPPGNPGAPVIAFVSTRDVGPGGGLEEPWIYLADDQGNVLSRLVRGDAPAWSPDGQWIAYQRWTGGRIGEGERQVAIINIDGSGAQVVGSGGGPSWSPDGSTIVYDNGEGAPGEAAIYAVRPGSGGPRRKLLDYASLPPDDGYGAGWVGFATYSPDGATISFVRANYGVPWAVYLMSSDGSNPRELLAGVGDTPPRWSPDGSRLLVMLPSWSPTSPTWYIASVALDGSLSQSYAQARYVGYPEWSPDGQMFLYASFSLPPASSDLLGRRLRIYIHPLGSGEPRQFIAEANNPVSAEYWDTQAVWLGLNSGAGQWDYLRR